MPSTESLQNRIKQLEQENIYLKSLLEKAGIPYVYNEPQSQPNAYNPNQGARILPRRITDDDAKRFFGMFWGRMDVYSKRTVKKSTGEVGYYPQCYNLWSSGCHRLTKGKVKCKDCEKLSYRKLELKDIVAHLNGESDIADDVIGIYPLLPDDTCRFLVYDFDNHDVGAEKNDFANTDDAWKEEVNAMREICRINGIDALVERSRSGRGAHLWIFFQKPIEASLVRKFGNALLRKGSESVNLKSFRFYDRMLPMQDHLPSGGLGNLIALPLQGKALLEGNSAFIDENWNAYPNQWEVLFEKPKLTQEFIEEKIKEWQGENRIQTVEGTDFHTERGRL